MRYALTHSINNHTGLISSATISDLLIHMQGISIWVIPIPQKSECVAIAAAAVLLQATVHVGNGSPLASLFHA